MFIEPQLNSFSKHQSGAGWIEVVCGSMFSGKTEELIRRVNRAIIAQQEVKIFKPSIDIRYHEVKVVSHNSNEALSSPVEYSEQILSLAGDADVVAIDEAQFMDEGLIDVCVKLANEGKRVIVCGLDMDFEGKPFGIMPQLMSIAEFITKLHAICMQCGDVASFSYRLTASKQKVVLGEKDAYEARCRKCFTEGMESKEEEMESVNENG
ncbi:MAG: thymidine kinase [Flammeovirgaceae bacterium]